MSSGSQIVSVLVDRSPRLTLELAQLFSQKHVPFSLFQGGERLMFVEQLLASDAHPDHVDLHVTMAWGGDNSVARGCGDLVSVCG